MLPCFYSCPEGTNRAVWCTWASWWSRAEPAGWQLLQNPADGRCTQSPSHSCVCRRWARHSCYDSPPQRHWRMTQWSLRFRWVLQISHAVTDFFLLWSALWFRTVHNTHCVHFCNLPKSPLSRVNERLVNMHSNATRWNTLLTVLCVPTIRTYLRHSHYRMLVSRKAKRHLILTDEQQPFGQYHFSMTPSFIKGQVCLKTVQLAKNVHVT